MSKIIGVPDDWAGQNFSPIPDAASATISPASTSSTASTTPSNVLYLTEPGDAAAIEASDIHQGQLGDCFLLSSFGEIARDAPSFISNMITANSNGTETVRLYEAATGRLPGFGTTVFKAVTETVTNSFSTSGVNNGATQDVANNMKEIWPQVLEKAVAQLNGGYSAIANGGSPVVALEELTGHAASYVSPASLTTASLTALANAGDLLVFDTLSKSGLPDNLVSNHAYMFNGLTGSGSSAAVNLINPWGTNQPGAVLVSQLSKGFAEVDIGQLT